MDGWLSETGFFAHNVDQVGAKLNIPGYTDKINGGDKWWNFDLPSNWQQYIDKPLEEVCLNQWAEAHFAIFRSEVKTLMIKFEDFILNPQSVTDQITNYLGIGKLISKELPMVMVTFTPSNYRWKKRESMITDLSKLDKVQKLMNLLDYNMDPKTWI